MYAGVDVHKDYCHGVLMDENGEVFKEEDFDNSVKGVRRFFGGFESAQVVIEACYSWRPTLERLEEFGLEVKMAHPRKTKAIAEAEIKTDSIDATTLAHLLRARLIPESYVPPDDIRELRDKTRARAGLGKERTRMKNKIKAELEKNRITMDINPFTIKGKEKLRGFGVCTVKYYLEMLETIQEQIDEIETDFEEIAEKYEEAKLLMTIPGVGAFSALLILAEIGDIDRFPDPEKLCSYAGLVPKVHKSGNITRYGNIKKAGSKYLRWILVEDVWIHVGCADSQLTKYYRKKKREKGDGRMAAIATARKMLTAIYYMLKRGEEYRSDG
ncbi:hypothetical protein AKJ40_01780 [candidate division MSBL1 archaeon SCGC-AAA259M10]|uniref:Uncharacterized protein n=1 Tax=candidate division MSBL1 archaeon SCGC-AAA259M10 TaxID=1698270 RepID=A0A133V165_9EURY|nr:hypothetical protein AKJ40_01780 [candidate division MSBL1 archaeon SCGC-AAA259M10]